MNMFDKQGIGFLYLLMRIPQVRSSKKGFNYCLVEKYLTSS